MVKSLSLAVLSALAGCAGSELRTVPAGYAQSGGRLLVKPGWHRIELRSASGQNAVREALLGSGDDVALSVQMNGGSR